MDSWKRKNARNSPISLMLKMTLNVFKRFWRLFWIGLVAFGFLWTFYFAVLNRHLPPKLQQDVPFPHEDMMLHKSSIEKYESNHPKALKKPLDLPKEPETKDTKMKSDIQKAINQLNRKRLDTETPKKAKQFELHNSNVLKPSNGRSAMEIPKNVTNSIEVGNNKSVADKIWIEKQTKNQISGENRELPMKFPQAHDQNMFNRSKSVRRPPLNEKDESNHAKSLERPLYLQKNLETKNIEMKNDAQKAINQLNRNRIDAEQPLKKPYQFHKSNVLIPSDDKSAIKHGMSKHKLMRDLEQKQTLFPMGNANPLKTGVQTRTQQNIKLPNYYEDNLRSNWTFKISKNYKPVSMRKWTDPIKMNISNPSAPGENGNAFIPAKDEVEIMEQLKEQYNFNAYASDKMSLHRSLPDYRFAECQSLTYPEKLPTTSVIIVVHNELWSTLFRTVWSVIDRSPPELIEEIILVDDDSTWSHLKRALEDYAATIPANIRIIRTKQREGLIRARLIGANEAKGSVLTFLDAHMEVTAGWLQPILSRIASDRSVVAVPLIDAIVSGDMGFSPASKLPINTLRWHLIFNWMEVPPRELKRIHNDVTAPVRIPTHVGCAFSVDREFFFEIGSYDKGMDIWGSENVELAFRVWLCGGALEVLPCSRVGHLYRISTYSFGGDSTKITNRNNKRLVEVWMDEYKELYYAANPEVQKVSAGNLTERFDLKKRLKCKNFRWYLENVYPESVFSREYTMMGELKSADKKWCLDIYTTAINGELKLFPCHNSGGNQHFAFTKSGQIVTVEDNCVGISNKRAILVKCEEDKRQLWDFNEMEKWIVHRESKLCMQNDNDNVIMGKCNGTDIRTKWNFKSTWQHDVKKLIPAEKNLTPKNDKIQQSRIVKSLTPNGYKL